MNLHSRLLLCSLAVGCLFASAAFALPPVRIMPLGDEITYGQGVAGGYRLPLYVALTNAGFNVDYVGTRTDNATNALPDSNHQGQVSNWRIDGTVGNYTGGLSENLYQFLNVINDPDVVLLHIGGNDTNSLTTVTNRLNALISRVATNRPCAHIIVTTLLPRGDAYSNQVATLVNPYVESLVSSQISAGRKVHFLDMNSKLTLSDLTGTPLLYPSAAGYGKMADTWYTAITNIITPYGDTNTPPFISRALGITNLTQVTVTFTKALDPASATNLANYAIDGGLGLTQATLSADQRSVTLTTTPQATNVLYTITVNNVSDITPSPGPLAIAANSTVTFKSVCRGYLNNVAESAGYNLLYSLDLPNSANYGANPVPYTVDNSVLLENGNISRVAYYAELQYPNGQMTYLWVSMNAFTNKLIYLGVPTTNTLAAHQKTVSNLTVQSNDPTITNGSGLSGNIEFWPCNYDAPNSNNIPGASSSTFDFGDRPTPGTYGSMQIHNYAAAQTLFSFSNWGTTSTTAATPDIGIGTCPSPKGLGYDWTFSNDAGMYTIKTLQVLVQRGTDTTPPTLVSAKAGIAGTLVTVTFSEPLNPDSVSGTRFALDNGVNVLSATLLPDLRTVNLITSQQPIGAALTLTVNGVRDSAAGNAIAPDSAIAVEAASLPPEVVARAGASANGYQLVYTLDIPLKGNFNGAQDFYRYNQSLATGTFDRVAYYLELVTLTGTTQYLWTAMDAFTPYRTQVGVPIAAAKATYQMYVTNVEVKCNVAGVSNGTFATGCNLEFWPSSYSQTNTLSVTNASSSTYDWGDSVGTTSAGHGSMQIHNAALQHTLFGLNHFGTDNNTIDLGIGNRPSNNDKDWTNAGNAGTYIRRLLHVLVHSSVPGTSGLPAEVAAKIPGAAGYQLVCAITNIPAKGKFDDATWASKFYAVDLRSKLAPNSFNRVAYYMELQKSSDPVPQYVWTSFDTFTADGTKIAVPTSGTYFQQRITNLDVDSNKGGVTTGTGITTGNIEFWPSSYTQTNAIGIPGASQSTFDFGDGGASSSGGGHGSMQVHNYGAAQTLFAFNHFNGSNDVALGIGNNPVWSNNDPDWTFTYNANTYDVRRVLYVFVLPGGDPDRTPPTLVKAFASVSRSRVVVTFSEPLSDNAVSGSFTLDGGASVTGAQLSTNKTEVTLTTTPLTGGQTYTITVSGVRDRSSNNNVIVPGSTVTFTAPAGTVPAAITSGVPEIGTDSYKLVYQLAIQNSLNYIPSGAPYAVDESRFPADTFDRVAYCLELQTTNGLYSWAYVSMDAFTADNAKIGVPTPDRGVAWQRYVSNMNVYASANVANIAVTTGVGIASGNIEFWPSNYGVNNDKGVPGAQGVVVGAYSNVYDFGDSTGSASAGHGCMQIHNYLAGHTILAFNHFGNNSNFIPCLGLGNNTNFTSAGNADYDWTFNYNGALYSTKNLYVLVRPGPTPAALVTATGALPTIMSQPQNLIVHERDSFFFSVQATGAYRYQWRHNGVPIPGANYSYFESSLARKDDEGSYDVLVYGPGPSFVTSAPATLGVLSLGSVMLLK